MYKIFVYTSKYCFNLHEIVSYITSQRTQGLRLLYTLSGSDFTYSFFGKGAHTWLNLYLKDNKIFNVFQELVIYPQRFDELFVYIENFVLKLYKVADPTVGSTSARYEKLLHTKISYLQELPPSRDALIAHARRAVYIAAFYWGKSYHANPQLPPPIDWGWYRDGGKLKFVLTENRFTQSPFDSLFKQCTCKPNSSACLTCFCSKRGLPCYRN